MWSISRHAPTAQVAGPGRGAARFFQESAKASDALFTQPATRADSRKEPVMKRISQSTSLCGVRAMVHLGAVPLLTAAAAAAAVGIGLGTAASAAADTSSVSTPSSVAGAAHTGNDMQLQIQMNHGENSKYTVISNVMKTKHDTVKNSIGNVR